MAKYRTMYMLTIDGLPAGQDERGYTWFMCANGGGSKGVPLFETLAEVRSKIHAAREHDLRRKSTPTFRYDYQRVRVPVLTEGEP